ncbi:hypothetical protein K437DRAFT_257042 [Tilletiaria anomala UBC 951]|uniref:PHD-type domain-containing protein n=1 Tax=Tilletiaria anomala (strain ATCC 24038 / CBS 436.72 / UBC 951) TaxID=1037660 RepID=A0A066VS19_TILAU|nr:uncharacterized protein K437DRAFT_257042 [Tilletiaria anomala UBC 951]KDN44522.1 hypothetical protein K437DRAFT_257042 [Tilletiaria anomala UBC 951]
MYDWIDRHVQTLDLELQKSESELGGISVRRGTSWSGALREAQGLDAGKGGAGGTGGAGRKRKGASTGLDGDVSASAGTSNAPKKLKGTMATLSRKASSKKKWRVAELMEEASLEGPPPTLNGLGSVAAAMAAAQRLEGEPTYCYCDSISFGAMIQCDNSDSCPIEWFHWPCIGLQTEPKSKWYCAYCRPKGWKGPGMDVPPMAPKAPP